MASFVKKSIMGLALIILLVALPLTGVWLAGEPLSPYLHFPPQTTFVPHAPFSWVVFTLLALFVAAVISPFAFRLLSATAPTTKPSPHQSLQKFPWWGWAGLFLVFVAWLLAWNRFPWFQPLQPYTFLPLWLGYIVTINALAVKRTGSCPLLDRPGFYLALFPASSVFWWFFEYLNRFVQNWHYLGIETFTPEEYILHATLCFSTVLPAVIGTEEYLASFPRLTAPLTAFRPICFTRPKTLGWAVLAASCLSLLGTGVWPDYLFPMLWVAPLLIITALQAIAGRKTIFAPICKGEWRPVLLPALAALICGFFWEMWNVKSLAHWEYSVPFVQRFHFFEMPLLGYAGYLPFGLECRVVADLLRKS